MFVLGESADAISGWRSIGLEEDWFLACPFFGDLFKLSSCLARFMLQISQAKFMPEWERF